jgi:hypothetical protein
MTMHLTILSSTVKHEQFLTRQSKDNKITHSNVTYVYIYIFLSDYTIIQTA